MEKDKNLTGHTHKELTPDNKGMWKETESRLPQDELMKWLLPSKQP